jgi:hypothetical protein
MKKMFIKIHTASCSFDGVSPEQFRDDLKIAFKDEPYALDFFFDSISDGGRYPTGWSSCVIECDKSEYESIEKLLNSTYLSCCSKTYLE